MEKKGVRLEGRCKREKQETAETMGTGVDTKKEKPLGRNCRNHTRWGVGPDNESPSQDWKALNKRRRKTDPEEVHEEPVKIDSFLRSILRRKETARGT